MSYRKTAHSVYNIKYHIVWITKYRKKVLKGQIRLRLRDLVRQICLKNEDIIVSGNVQIDPVHLLVSMPPSLSVSKQMQLLKGRTSRKMIKEFADLKRDLWGGHLRARGYFVASTGNVADEVIKQYIESQGKEPPKDQDNFDVGNFRQISFAFQATYF